MHEPKGQALPDQLSRLSSVTDWPPALIAATRTVLLADDNRATFGRLQIIVSLRDDVVPPARARVERFLYSLAPVEVCAFWDEATAYVAAVSARSLAGLLGERVQWQPAAQNAAADWLGMHATAEQALDLAEAAGHPEVAKSAATWPREYWAADIALDLTALMSPLELGRAWRAVLGKQAALGLLPAKIIREWAKAQGLPVGKHGRISKQIRDQYDAAHKSGAWSSSDTADQD